PGGNGEGRTRQGLSDPGETVVHRHGGPPQDSPDARRGTRRRGPARGGARRGSTTVAERAPARGCGTAGKPIAVHRQLERYSHGQPTRSDLAINADAVAQVTDLGYSAHDLRATDQKVRGSSPFGRAPRSRP